MKFKKKHQIILLFIAAALAIVWLSDQPTHINETIAPDVSIAESIPELDVTLQGQLGVVYGDAANFAYDETHVFLTEADGDVVELYLSDTVP